MAREVLYGRRTGDIHGRAREIEAALGIGLELHDSLFRGGDYYRNPHGEYEIILQENFPDHYDGELAEPDHPDHALLLYANGSDGRYEEILNALPGLERLLTKEFDD